MQRGKAKHGRRGEAWRGAIELAKPRRGRARPRRHGTAGMTGSGRSRCDMIWHSVARQNMTRQATQGQPRQGAASRGASSLDSARSGQAGYGRRSTLRSVGDSSGYARRDQAWQELLVLVRRCLVRRATAGRSTAGETWKAPAGQDGPSIAKARQARQAGRVRAGTDSAQRSELWPGVARCDMAGEDRRCFV